MITRTVIVLRLTALSHKMRDVKDLWLISLKLVSYILLKQLDDPHLNHPTELWKECFATFTATFKTWECLAHAFYYFPFDVSPSPFFCSRKVGSNYLWPSDSHLGVFAPTLHAQRARRPRRCPWRQQPLRGRMAMSKFQRKQEMPPTSRTPLSSFLQEVSLGSVWISKCWRKR